MLKVYIRELMANRRIDNISDLMKMSGVSRNTIAKLYHEENIDSIRINTLIKLCDALDCKLSELIEYTP